MDYSVIDYKCYSKDELLFTFERLDFIVFSIFSIKDSKGMLLLKYRMFFPWLVFGLGLKILYQNFQNGVSLRKNEGKFYFVSTDSNGISEINIKTKFKIFGKFEGDFFIDGSYFGKVLQKGEKNTNRYFFEFEKENKLVLYCLILFSIRYYYLEDTP